MSSQICNVFVNVYAPDSAKCFEKCKKFMLVLKKVMTEGKEVVPSCAWTKTMRERALRTALLVRGGGRPWMPQDGDGVGNPDRFQPEGDVHLAVL